MSSYYFAIVFISIMAMCVNLLQLTENETFSRQVKKSFITVAIFIILGIFCEYCSFRFDESASETTILHGIIKAVEFSIAPIIPIFYVKIIEGPKNNMRKSNFLSKISNILIIFNIICELVSIFVPFVFYIDGENVYHHGAFYFVYVGTYFINISIFIIEFLHYTKKYQLRNIISLISILCFLLFGLSVHFINSEIYTDWLIVVIVFIMFLVYYSDLSLKVDALTDLLNRKSYEYKLSKLDYISFIIILDCNNFKYINDKYGHLVGDKVLKIIAKEIMNVYSKYGYCYRIGGDEFSVISKPKTVYGVENIDNFVEELNTKFKASINKYIQDGYPVDDGVSIGWSLFEGIYNTMSTDTHYIHPKIKETIKNADRKMYEDKQNNK